MGKTVTWELVQLAKQAGFDEPCMHAIEDQYFDLHTAFDLMGEMYFLPEDIKNADENCEEDGTKHYLVPEIDQLVNWVRKKHNYFLLVKPSIGNRGSLSWQAKFYKLDKDLVIDYDNVPAMHCNIYEVCVEDALKTVLKEIINEQHT